jgi:hypothetical protein
MYAHDLLVRLLVVPVHVVEGVQSDFEFRLAREHLLCRKDTNRYIRTQCTGYTQQHYEHCILVYRIYRYD